VPPAEISGSVKTLVAATAALPRLACRLILAGTLALALLAGTRGPAEAANTGFVRTQGPQFALNGAPFFFAGTNAFYLMVSAAWGATNYTDDTLAMAAQLGFSVLRAWAFFDGPDPLALQPAPGVFNEASFRALDYVLFKADQAGVRLLLPLVNGHPADFGGTSQYVAWCAPGQSMLAFYTHPACRQLYKNFVATLLTRVNTYTGRRYLDDPTVFAWELANEPELPDNLDPSGQSIRAWVAEMAAFIKALDPNHLVGTGESGFDVSAAGYSPVGATYGNQAWLFNGIKGVAFAQNSADPNVDFASIHLYPEYWNLAPQAGAAWIADHARLARSLGKPLVLGEFGASQDAAATYASWLQTVDTEQVGGALVWQLMCPACFGMRDQFGVAYPPASPVSNRLAQAAATANAKSGGPAGPGAPPGSPPEPPAPPAPGTMPFGVFVAAGNVDGSGASELVTGAGAGGSPHVRVFRADGTDFGVGFMAYDPAFGGGVRVAVCDVDGDGVADIITAAGPGAYPHVRVFSLAGGLHDIASFLAYDASFRGGVFVACGDIDGDGRAEIVTSPGAGGGPHVRVWRLAGPTPVEVVGFFAFDAGFTGGVQVAVGDLDGDGRADIVAGAGPGGGPHVRAFTLAGGVRELASFFAYDPAFLGGVYVAAADLGGDGRAEIVTGAGGGGGSHVRVFTGTGADTGMGFFAYDPSFTGGVRVGIVDVGGGGRSIVTAPGPGGGPNIRLFNPNGTPSSTDFMAY
jgi:cellulase (glycosyl hydrolase family 5)/VCBS repeat protein